MSGYADRSMASSESNTILDAAGIARTLERMANDILRDIRSQDSVAVIGIRRRGEVLASRLVELLKRLGAGRLEVGTLDITLYRDDLAEIGPQAVLRDTLIDFDVNGQYIILVDDVLYTGRSIRAALDALIDLGRPKAIRLAILVDRPGRELPIQADFAGIRVERGDRAVDVLLQDCDGVDEVRLQ